MTEGWSVRTTTLSDSYDFEAWQADNSDAVILAELQCSGALVFITSETKPKWASGHSVIALAPARKEKTA